MMHRYFKCMFNRQMDITLVQFMVEILFDLAYLCNKMSICKYMSSAENAQCVCCDASLSTYFLVLGSFKVRICKISYFIRGLHLVHGIPVSYLYLVNL